MPVAQLGYIYNYYFINYFYVRMFLMLYFSFFFFLMRCNVKFMIRVVETKSYERKRERQQEKVSGNNSEIWYVYG